AEKLAMQKELELEKQKEKERDLKRISDINIITESIEEYFRDVDQYPETLSDISDYLENNLPQDPNNGETIKGNVFGYKYEVLKGVFGNEGYRISTYLESEDNKEKLILDEGIHDDKFEIYNIDYLEYQ
ncbi:MAG: hypothetical protein GY828_01665, partial [Candidatus Gracilibacteria bacterium]|nr:hypothetical protein [Candidatus Gracilibacteria bacterium]